MHNSADDTTLEGECYSSEEQNQVSLSWKEEYNKKDKEVIVTEYQDPEALKLR